jgi:hypothetical protein
LRTSATYAPFPARSAREFATLAVMKRPGDVIAAQVASWGGPDLPLERELFGTSDPDSVAGAIDRWCVEHLGAGVARYRFFDASSGSVHGVDLVDGRAVVVKGHRSSVAREFLAAVLGVQAGLAARGFPAPRVLVEPMPSGRGHLTAEALLPQTRPDDTHAPAVRTVVARELARLVALAAPHADALRPHQHPMRRLVDGLYPVPHSPRFDFAATTAGAGWIDALMRGARARLAELPPDRDVVTHGDWRAQNLSIRDGEIDAVYDWDSVAVIPELGALAAAAVTFGVDWSRHQPRRLSTPREMAAFVGEYTDARGSALTVEERERLACHLVVGLAYGARCEHAVRAGEPPTGDDSQRALLRALGAALLGDGLDALDT